MRTPSWRRSRRQSHRMRLGPYSPLGPSRFAQLLSRFGAPMTRRLMVTTSMRREGSRRSTAPRTGGLLLGPPGDITGNTDLDCTRLPKLTRCRDITRPPHAQIRKQYDCSEANRPIMSSQQISWAASMFEFPARCTRCGTIFRSGIAADNASNMSMSNNMAGPCPRCGAMGRVIDGVFDVSQGKISVRAAPPETFAVLKALEAALAAARAGAEAEIIIDDLRKTSPEIAKDAQRDLNKGVLAFLVAMLLYLITSCSNNTTGKVDWNLLVDQAHVYVTGKEAHPGISKREAPSADNRTESPTKTASEAKPSRQQRRYLERQTNKRQSKSAAPLRAGRKR